MLTAYFDDSAHGGLVGYGGFLGHVDAWDEFDGRWRRALAKHGVSALHMKSLTKFNGEFVGWSKERQKDLLVDTLGVLSTSKLLPLGVLVWTPAYDALTDNQRRWLGSPCLRLAFRRCLIGAALGLSHEEEKEPVAIICDKQRGQEGWMRKDWEMLKDRAPMAARFTTIAFADDRDFPGLQAADLLIYELRREHDEELRRPQMRTPLNRIVGMSDIPLLRAMFLRKPGLLRLLAEGGCPDRTGMDALPPLQGVKERVDMLDWVVNRAQWQGAMAAYLMIEPQEGKFEAGKVDLEQMVRIFLRGRWGEIQL